MTSREHTLIYVEEEFAAAEVWGRRREIPLTLVSAVLEVRVTLTQPETGEMFFLRGQLDDYREIPPAWTFTDGAWSAPPSPQLFPKPASSPPGGASIFHTQPVICAPFNRLAYKEHAGPHHDWGGPGSWLTAGAPNQVKAHFLGDMLSVIHQHFIFTRGRMP